MQQGLGDDHLKSNVVGVVLNEDNSGGQSDSEPLVTIVESVKNKPSLNVLALVCMGFFWVSGGMYGNEELMRSAAPVYALPCLLVVPLLYSCPVSLINSELAGAMPWEGGAVAWIGEALGRLLGAQTAYWIWFATVLDSSLYPRFAASYLAKQFDWDYVTKSIAAMVIVVLINVVKLGGMKSVASVSIALAAISVAPSFILVGMGFDKISWDTVIDDSGESTNFAELMTWILWLYSGVLSMGSVSKDVKNAGRTYLLSSIILFSLDVLIVNFTPLLISLSVDPNREDYKAGHFIQIGNSLAGGKWLGILLTVASQISLIGLYQSGSVASDQYLSRLVHNYLAPSWHQGPTVAKMVTGSPILGPKPRSKVHRWFFGDENDAGVPRIMIFMNAPIVMCLCWVSIADTMTVSVLLMSLGIALLTISFLVFKFRRPDLKRTVSVPGGRIGALLIAIPCLSLALLNIGLGFADTSERLHNIPKRPVAFSVVLVFGALVQLIGGHIKRRASRREAELLRVVIMPADPVSYDSVTIN